MPWSSSLQRGCHLERLDVALFVAKLPINPTACRKQAVQHTGTTDRGLSSPDAKASLPRVPMSETSQISWRREPVAFLSGAIIGTLGGLIGLGGAEFRLPLLISLFRFRGLEAVILNKATSFVVVAAALPFRAGTISFEELGAQWPIIANLLAGSLIGAWVGASWATRLKSETLYRVIAVLLVLIAGILLFAHDTTAGAPFFAGWIQIVAGIIAGFVIGVIASASWRGRW